MNKLLMGDDNKLEAWGESLFAQAMVGNPEVATWTGSYSAT
jgi:hypothetical protein